MHDKSIKTILVEYNTEKIKIFLNLLLVEILDIILNIILLIYEDDIKESWKEYPEDLYKGEDINSEEQYIEKKERGGVDKIDSPIMKSKFKTVKGIINQKSSWTRRNLR